MKMKISRIKIRRQMYAIYALALLIPMAVLGSLLLRSASDMLNEHYIALLESDNRRLKTLFSEITTQVYETTGDIFYDQSIKRLLSAEYESNMVFVDEVNKNSTLDTLLYNSSEIDAITIYTDNPTIYPYKQFRPVTQEIADAAWYQQALETTNPAWVTIPNDGYGTIKSNLCLVRRLVLPESDYHAVVVSRVSDASVRSVVDAASIVDVVSLDDAGIVYSSRRAWYGQEAVLDIDYDQDSYRFSGKVNVEGEAYFAAVSTLHLYRTNSRLYICTLDSSGLAAIDSILNRLVLMLVFAVVIPGIILILFANYFSRRVNLLREEMHKASSQDYNIISDFSGRDELTEAFQDLKSMVQDIKQKDAKMYQAELNAKELRTSQQIMEYKVLASQINPHYLYNTLETIRMKALTVGDRQVADAVKLLGKTLHYIQENTGLSYTTLQRELDHVENYLSIQKLRFGERINHTVTIDPRVEPEHYSMLPLLLQPLVENAVVHGLEGISGIGQVDITIARADDDHLHICIRDSGKGMSLSELNALRQKLESPEMPESSVALYNIHRRVQLSCGGECGLRISSLPDQGTAVTLVLPANSQRGDSSLDTFA